MSLDSNAPYFELTKLDAAKRQLETAITLFMKNGDKVSIHTLASAAHEVLADLCTKQGHKSFLKHEMVERVKPEYRSMIRRKFVSAQNYFKHADRDGKPLKFYYGPTEFTIWDCCLMYQKLTQENTPLVSLFLSWFYLEHSDLLLKGEMKEASEKIGKGWDPKNKTKFLNEALPIIIEMST